MKAKKPLWINSNGDLVDKTPESGIKIAACSGFEIPSNIVAKYKLVDMDGEIVRRHQTNGGSLILLKINDISEKLDLIINKVFEPPPEPDPGPAPRPLKKTSQKPAKANKPWKMK